MLQLIDWVKRMSLGEGELRGCSRDGEGVVGLLQLFDRLVRVY